MLESDYGSIREGDDLEERWDNRRRFKRVDFPCPARVGIGSETVEAACKDISVGATFLWAAPVPIGTRVTVAFEHPPAQRFEGEVTSCYQREGRSGMVVRFTHLSANGLQTLVKVIEARSPQA